MDTLLNLVEEQFSSEVKLAYQKRDSIYSQLVTTRAVPVGDSTYFNRAQAGTPAGKKARFGKVPRNGGSLDRVKCDLETFYAADEIDEQEVSSTSVNGMLVITDNAIASMSRKVDEMILDVINGQKLNDKSEQPSSLAGVSNTDAMSLDIAKAIWAHYQRNHIFKNKELPIVNVGVAQWNQLMSIKQFYHADIIGSNDLPYLFSRAETGRFFMDMVWRVDPDLPNTGTGSDATTTCNAFVQSCIGLALGGVDKTRVIETEDDTILWYMRRKLGAVLIDPVGVLSFELSNKDVSTNTTGTFSMASGTINVEQGTINNNSAGG